LTALANNSSSHVPHVCWFWFLCFPSSSIAMIGFDWES
jgi:hypothetical protein